MKYADAAKLAREAGIDPEAPTHDIIDFFEEVLYVYPESEAGADRRYETADRWAVKYDAGDDQ